MPIFRAKSTSGRREDEDRSTRPAMIVRVLTGLRVTPPTASPPPPFASIIPPEFVDKQKEGAKAEKFPVAVAQGVRLAQAAPLEQQGIPVGVPLSTHQTESDGIAQLSAKALGKRPMTKEQAAATEAALEKSKAEARRKAAKAAEKEATRARLEAEARRKAAAKEAAKKAEAERKEREARSREEQERRERQRRENEQQAQREREWQQRQRAQAREEERRYAAVLEQERRQRAAELDRMYGKVENGQRPGLRRQYVEVYSNGGYGKRYLDGRY